MSKIKVEIVADRKQKIKLESEPGFIVLTASDSGDPVNDATIRLNKQGLRRLKDSLSMCLANFESLK